MASRGRSSNRLQTALARRVLPIRQDNNGAVEDGLDFLDRHAMLFAFVAVSVVPVEPSDRRQIHGVSIYKCQYLSAFKRAAGAPRHEGRLAEGFDRRSQAWVNKTAVTPPRASRAR